MLLVCFKRDKIQNSLPLALTLNPRRDYRASHTISFVCYKYNLLPIVNPLGFTMYFPSLIWEVCLLEHKDETEYVTTPSSSVIRRLFHQ